MELFNLYPAIFLQLNCYDLTLLHSQSETTHWDSANLYLQLSLKDCTDIGDMQIYKLPPDLLEDILNIYRECTENIHQM